MPGRADAGGLPWAGCAVVDPVRLDSGLGPAGSAPVYVVAGPPGAGKTTAAELLLRRLRPAPALLDKDVLFAGFVAQLQAAYGRQPGEREGDWYDTHVKGHEYSAMTASARQIRGHGCAVMLVAPFTAQIRDPDAWRSWVAALGGDPVHLIWVRSDAETLRARLLARASPRDASKLADFERFLARMLPDTPPPVPHRELDNRFGATGLADAAEQCAVDLCALTPAEAARPDH